ncbi:MAG: hypothetical protein WCF24_05325 [Acidimicrobiales bacterium]
MHALPRRTEFPRSDQQGDFFSERGEINGQKVDTISPQYNSANKECTHLLPNGGNLTAAELQQLLTQALKWTQCLRQHGLPNMPEPVEHDGGLTQSFPRGGPNSPQFKAATRACHLLAPGGGP